MAFHVQCGGLTDVENVAKQTNSQHMLTHDIAVYACAAL